MKSDNPSDLNLKLNQTLRILKGKKLIYTIGTLGGFLLLFNREYFINSSNNATQKIETNDQIQKSYFDTIKRNLINKEPKYIEAPNIEKIISLPRYQRVLYLIKQANHSPSKSNKQKLIDELLKLNNESKEDTFNKATININNNKNLLTINKTDTDTTNPFLNNGLANHISQLLSNDFMFEMALKAPEIDNRFFRNELPTIIQKLNETCPSYSPNYDTNPLNIYDDIDYALILEFHHKFANVLVDSKHSSFSKNKNLNVLLNTLRKEINALIISEYLISQRPKVSIWSTDDSDISYAEYDEAIDDARPSQTAQLKTNDKVNNLKKKMKFAFIERNEAAIMNLVELMVKLNTEEFVNMMGMEFLLLLYEKHKYEESYVTSIGNCLCLISLDKKYRHLFLYSGWLKRLNQMCNKKLFGIKKSKNEKESGSIDLIRELTAHKIIYNLNQVNDENSVLYSTMLFPMYPMYTCPATNESEDDKNRHSHTIDVVFIHGLRGSLFRTWRQNDDSYPSLSKTTKPAKQDGANIEEKILDKLNTFIDIQLNEKFSYCWPKDWLIHDLNLKRLDPKRIDNIRLIGISYHSFFSSWLENIIDDKNLKTSIKQRALDLIEQLDAAHIGQRPIVWICHSMGGLIVKQILVHIKEQEMKLKQKTPLNNLLNNTKGIVFYSTPHLGSDVAKKVTNFSFALYTSNEIAELSSDSKYLLDLNNKFLKLILNHGRVDQMKILSICESLPTYFAFNVFATTVTEASARLGIGEFHLADCKDHLNVCKPDDKKCLVYTKQIDFINQITDDETLNCVNCQSEPHVDQEADLDERNYLLFSYFSNF